MLKRIVLFGVVGLLVVLALGPLSLEVYLRMQPGPPFCASAYAETDDPRFLDALPSQCWWWMKERSANQAQRLQAQTAVVAEQQRAAAAAAVVRTKQEKEVLEQAREKVCEQVMMQKSRATASSDTDIGRFASGDGTFHVTIIGLDGHSPLYSLEANCPQCRDGMSTYFDLDGKRFCNVGGIAGRTCEEAKPWPRAVTISRKGTPDELWKQLGCDDDGG